jgi:hypothetical protein
MTATPNFASDALAELGAGDATAPVASAGPFVLNLCSSTTPMALAQTDLPELKRFTFFVSRRFEEGRERFRLHMGYFATLAEAEEWLNVVREIYPGAWAGEAPGRKLRERAAAAAAAQAQHAAGPQQSSVAPVAAPPAPHPFAAVPAPAPLVPDPIPVLIPVLQAAPSTPPAAASARVARPPAPTPPPPPAPRAAPPAPAAAAPRKPAAAETRTAPVAPPARAAVAGPAAVAPTRASAPVAAAPPARNVVAAQKPAAAMPPAVPSPGAAPGASRVFGDSNVREVLKALGDASATGETRLMRTPSPPRAPVAPPAKEALSDTQVLKLLEVRRPEGAEPQAQSQDDPAHGAIPLLKPDDTGTREALKEAVASNAAVLFAVQLQWSVQAVELDRVPPLAIFSAYTLYTVEGSRDGRKWYGLRLGFFSDAISAKQVAHYVRSEFASVAVVPVSAQEKSRATDQDKQAATLGGAPARPSEPVDEFKLIDDSAALAAAAAATLQKRVPQPAAARATPALTDPAARKVPGRPIPKVAVGRKTSVAVPAPAAKAASPAAKRVRVPGKVGAGETRGAQSLEETLEILGAGQLAIDNGRGESLNESGVRHLRVEVQKGSPFARLLERLSERVKKP